MQGKGRVGGDGVAISCMTRNQQATHPSQNPAFAACGWGGASGPVQVQTQRRLNHHLAPAGCPLRKCCSTPTTHGDESPPSPTNTSCFQPALVALAVTTKQYSSVHSQSSNCKTTHCQRTAAVTRCSSNEFDSEQKGNGESVSVLLGERLRAET